METDYNFYNAMLQTALSAGLPIISTDTAARILSVINIYGNNEAYAMSPKLKCDLNYIQARFGIRGGDIPDREFADTLRWYIDDLKQYDANRKKFDKPYPEWATKLFRDRYNIKLIN